MKRDESVYLQHLLDAIAKIEEYLSGVSSETFKERTQIQDAVIRQIEIFGEATKHLSDNLRNEYAHVLWQDIAGMRDKLVHDYFGVDVWTVWLVATDDIPLLKLEIEKILNQIRGGDC